MLFEQQHLYYQGYAGWVATGVIALISSLNYLAFKRSLLPLILSHGMSNNIGLTLLFFPDAKLIVVLGAGRKIICRLRVGVFIPAIPTPTHLRLFLKARRLPDVGSAAWARFSPRAAFQKTTP